MLREPAKVGAHDLPREKAIVAGVALGVLFGIAEAVLGVQLPGWLPILGWLAAALVTTVVLHEGVHGAIAGLLGHRPIFGLKPPLVYVTFATRIPRRHFMAVAIAPLLVLDSLFLGLYAAGILETFALLGFLINTMGALGDVWMVAKLLPYSSTALVQDTKTGFEVWDTVPAGTSVP